MNLEIRQTHDIDTILAIAATLPEHFEKQALSSLASDAKRGLAFGIFLNRRMAGFAIITTSTEPVCEIAWLGIEPPSQQMGYGRALVEHVLASMTPTCDYCVTKTLADTDPYVPYKKTRAFYHSLGFVPVQTIDPFPGWGENACQIWVRYLPSHLTSA